MKRISASEPMSIPRQQKVEVKDRLPHLLFGFPALCSQNNQGGFCVTGWRSGNRGQVDNLIDWALSRAPDCRWGCRGKVAAVAHAAKGSI